MRLGVIIWLLLGPAVVLAAADNPPVLSQEISVGKASEPSAAAVPDCKDMTAARRDYCEVAVVNAFTDAEHLRFWAALIQSLFVAIVAIVGLLLTGTFVRKLGSFNVNSINIPYQLLGVAILLAVMIFVASFRAYLAPLSTTPQNPPAAEKKSAESK